MHAATCVAEQLCGLQVTKLSTGGQVKQYAEQRIAELQDLIAARFEYQYALEQDSVTCMHV